MQQKQEQKPAREQEHDPSKVAVKINIPPYNKHTVGVCMGGRGPLISIRWKGLSDRTL